MRILLYCLLAVLCPEAGAFAQSPPVTIHPLTIGDPMPNIILTNLIHYPVSKIHITDLKGKLIILDFWSTVCGSCVREFRKLDSLQKKYKEKIVVLGVSYEKNEKVKAFLINNRVANKTSFPIIAEDSILSKLFPHTSVPHEVWLDSNMNVYRITDPSYITSENIDRAMAGKEFNPLVKIDLEGYDDDKALSSSYNPLIENKVLYRSALYSYLSGIGSLSKIIDSVANTMTLRVTNVSILELYNQIIYQKDFGAAFNKRTILNVKNKDRYIAGDQQSAEWKNKNCYSYEITTKADTPDSLLKKWMLEDINRYLQLDGKIEKRKIKFFSLKVYQHCKSSSQVPSEEYDNLNNSIRLVNSPVKTLLIYLNKYIETAPNYPIIDDTGFNVNIDIALIVKQRCSFTELQKMLRPFGIDLQEQEREMKVFVLTER